MIYPKIQGPFYRHQHGPEKGQLDRTKWTIPEFETLRDVAWVFTEKVDGMNMRVEWDGFKVRYAGRTENAQIPGDLLEYMNEHFPEDLVEQQFGRSVVTLYGEGYGAGIQRGGLYGDDKRFILFDVRIGEHWLRRFDVEGIAMGFEVPCVDVYFGHTLNRAIDRVTEGLPSLLREGFAEGLVGTPNCGLLTRSSERIIVKVKHTDLYEEH